MRNFRYFMVSRLSWAMFYYTRQQFSVLEPKFRPPDAQAHRSKLKPVCTFAYSCLPRHRKYQFENSYLASATASRARDLQHELSARDSRDLARALGGWGDTSARAQRRPREDGSSH